MPHGEIEAARAYASRPLKCIAALFCLLRCVLRTGIQQRSDPDAALYCAGIYSTVPDLLKIARDINAATYQPLPLSALPRCSI